MPSPSPQGKTISSTKAIMNAWAQSIAQELVHLQQINEQVDDNEQLVNNPTLAIGLISNIARGNVYQKRYRGTLTAKFTLRAPVSIVSIPDRQIFDIEEDVKIWIHRNTRKQFDGLSVAKVTNESMRYKRTDWFMTENTSNAHDRAEVEVEFLYEQFIPRTGENT